MSQLWSMISARSARMSESRQEPGCDDTNELLELGIHIITTLSAIVHDEMEKGVTHGKRIPAYIQDLDSHEDECCQALGPLVPLMEALLVPAHRQLFPLALREVTDMIQEQQHFAMGQLVRRIAGIVRCNSIELTALPGGPPAGQALFGGIISLFNHSCAPNAAIDPDSRVLRTIRPIVEGEEVCISYIPQLYWPRKMRKRQLAERFYFTCTCIRCKDTSPTSADLEALIVAKQPAGPQVRSDPEEYYRAQVGSTAENCRLTPEEMVSPDMQKELKSLSTEVVTHCRPTHYLMQDLRNAGTYVSSVLGDAPGVMRSCREELYLWEIILPLVAHPAKVDKLRNIAVVQSQTGCSFESDVVSSLQLYDPAQ